MKIKLPILESSFFLLLFCTISPSQAQVNSTPDTSSHNKIVLSISGEVNQPLHLTLTALQALPEHSITVKDKNGAPHQYTGVYVQDVLSKAGVTTGHELSGENLSKYVLASCADGYQVVYSLAELDSSFVQNLPIIAYKIDGQPLFKNKGPLRMVMPEDKKPARSCFQLQTLSVHFAQQ